MSKTKCICRQCGKEFYAYNYQIARGGGKFCSISCGTTFRNLTNNPTRNAAVRAKIAENHADVSGENNPMYGRRGSLAPAYIDGRASAKLSAPYQRILWAAGVEKKCAFCGAVDNIHVHHKDHNHKNNTLENLMYLCVKCHNNIAHKRERGADGKFLGVKGA